MALKEKNADIVSLLSQNKKELDRIALEFLPKDHACRPISSLYSMMRDYPERGGKGLRGSICLEWCQLFGGSREKGLVTAAALELFQNWILIHDDIEDESDLRRGLPALHRKHGVALSINAGDALHGKMWELLLTNVRTLGPELCCKILSEFSLMLNETTEGQQMELSWTNDSTWDLTEEDYMMMVTKKAAWYTCTSPSRIGVLLAKLDVSTKLLERLVRLGTNLGIAFQIVDDVLNLTAEASKYGKEILGDLFEGKRTLMLIHLLNNCSTIERREVTSILSKRRYEKTKEEVAGVFQLMNHYGSVSYAEDMARRHSVRALEEYDKLGTEYDLVDSRHFSIIRSLMEYLTKRDY